MGKKLLGLGFVFSAIDKGVKNFLRQTSNQFEDVSKSVGHTEDALGKSKGSGLSGAMSRVIEGFKLMSLGKIASGIQGLGDKLEGIHHGSKETFQSLEKFLAEMDFTNGTKSARALTGQLIAVSNATGTNLDNMSAAAGVMLRQGMSTEQVNKSLMHMGNLIGVLGGDATQVGSAMAGWTKKVGGTVEEFQDMSQQAVLLQKHFKIAGFGAQFSGLALKTTEWANSMGLGKDQATKLLRGVTVLSGAFQASGLSAEEAAHTSEEFTQSLFNARRNLQKMRTGLQGSLDQHKDLAIVVGDVNTAFAAIENNDPSKAFQAIGNAALKMRKSGMSAEQVHVRLGEIFGENSQILTLVEKNFDKTSSAISSANDLLSDQATASKNGAKAFNGLVGAQKSTTAWSEQQLDVLKQNLGVMIRFATSGIVQKIFGLMAKGIGTLMTMFTRGWKIIGPFVSKALDMFGSLIEPLFGIGAAASGAIGGITSIVGAALMASGVLAGMLGIFGGVIGKVLSLGSMFLFVGGKPISMLLNKLGFVKAAAEGVGAGAGTAAKGGSLLGKAVTFLLSPFRALGKVLMFIVTGPMKLLSGAFGLVTKGMGFLGKGLMKLITGPFTFLASKFGIIGRAGSVFTAIFSKIGSVIGFVLSPFKNIGLLLGRMAMMLIGVLGPIGLAIVAIGALAAGAFYLYKNWKTIFAKLPEPVQSALVSVAQAWGQLTKWMQGKWAEFVNWFPGAFNGLKQTIDEKLKSIAKAFPDVMKSIRAGVADGVQGIIDAWKGFTSWLPNALKSMEKAATRIFNFLMGKPQEVSDEIAGTNLFSGLDLDFSSIVESMKTIGLEMWNGLKDGLNYLVSNFPKIVSEVWGVVLSIFKSSLKIQLKLVTGGLHLLIKGIVVVLRNLPVIIADVIRGIINFLKGGDGGGKLGEIMQSIAEGFVDFWKEIEPDVMALVNEIWSGIGEIFDAYLEGINEATMGWFGDLIDDATALWDGMVSWFSGFWERVREVFRSFWNGSITEDILGWWGILVSGGMGIFDGLLEYFPNLWGSVKQGAKDAWDSITGVFSGAWNAAVGVVEDGADSILTASSDLMSGLSGVWDSMTSKASAVWNTASSAISGAWDSISEKVSGGVSDVKGALESAWDSTLSSAQSWSSKIASKVSSAFDRVSDMAGEGLEAVSGAAQGLATPLAEGLRKAETEASQVLSSITKRFEGVTDVGDFVSRAFDLVVTSLDKLGSGVLGTIGGMISKALGALGPDVQKVGDFIMSVIGGSISRSFSLIVDTVSGLGSIVSKAFGGLFEAAGKLLSGDISGFAATMSTTLGTAFEGAFALSGSMVSKIIDGVVSQISTVFAAVDNLVGGKLSALVQMALSGVTDFGMKIVKGYTAAFGTLREGFDTFWKWFSQTSVGEMFSEMTEAAADMVKVFKGFFDLNKMTDSFKKFWDFLKGTAFTEKLNSMRQSFENLSDKTRSFLGFDKIMRGFNDFVVWVQGKNIGQILNDVGAMFSSMFSKISEFTGFDTIKKKFDQIASMAKDSFSALGDFLGINAIEEAFGKLFSFIKNGFKNIGMFDMIADMMNKFADILESTTPDFLKEKFGIGDFTKGIRGFTSGLKAPDVPGSLQPRSGATITPLNANAGAMPKMGSAAVNSTDPAVNALSNKVDDLATAVATNAPAGIGAPPPAQDVNVKVEIIGGKEMVRRVTTEQQRAAGRQMAPGPVTK